MFNKISAEKCACGKEHIFTSKVFVEKGAINKLPSIIKEMNFRSAFIIADKNTFSAAGEKVINVLEAAGINDNYLTKTPTILFSGYHAHNLAYPSDRRSVRKV